MKQPKNQKTSFTISKKFIRIFGITLTGIMLIPLVLFAGLLAWGIASGGWLFAVPLAWFVFSPISLVFINKLYPGQRLSRFNTVVEVGFLLAYVLIGVAGFFFPLANASLFPIMFVLYGVILCAAVYRVFRTIRQGDAPTRRKYIAATIGVAIVLALIAVLIVRADIDSRRNYSQVFDKATTVLAKSKAAPSVLQAMPVGGISTAQMGRGNGLWDESKNCGSDVSCPESKQAVLVQLKHNNEQAFFTELSRIFKQAPDEACLGFDGDNESAMCYMDFTEDGYRVTISLERADPYHHGSPDPSEGEKVWRHLVVTVYR